MGKGVKMGEGKTNEDSVRGVLTGEQKSSWKSMTRRAALDTSIWLIFNSSVLD